MKQLHIEEIDKGEVLRYLGYKPGVHALDASVEEQIAQASAVVLAAAAVRATSAVFPLEGEKGMLNLSLIHICLPNSVRRNFILRIFILS